MGKTGDYGWLDFGTASQRAGFFVDDDNQILYWPEEKQPGYVLDETTALTLVKSRNRLVSDWVFGALSILYLLTSNDIAQSVYPSFESAITPLPLWILVFILGYMVIAAAWLSYATFIRRPRYVSKVRKALANNQKIQAGRPQIRHPKTSVVLGPLMFAFSFGVSTLLAIVALGFALSQDELIGDRIGSAAVGLSLLGFVFLGLANERKGVPKSDIRMYQPPAAPQSSVTSARAAPRKRTLLVWFNWFTSGWRFWALAMPCVVFGTILVVKGLDEFKKAPVTGESLAKHYERLAYRSHEDPWVVTKWQDIIDVHIGASQDVAFRESLIDDLDRFARFTGRPITVQDGLSPQHGLEIIFSDELLTDENGRYTYYLIEWSHRQGELLHLKIVISMKSFRMALPGSTFADSRAQRRAERYLRREIVHHAFGLHGWLDRDTPIYIDAQGNRLRLLEALIALHYDPRLRPGTEREAALQSARAIADAISAAPSFEDWLKSREAEQVE